MLVLCGTGKLRRGTKRVFILSKDIEKGKASEPDEDFETIRRVLEGDVEAFSVLVRKHQKKMLNTAYQMTGDYEDACDIVQDSFIAAFKALRDFRGDAVFSTWLTGIVMNRARNVLKQRKSARGSLVAIGVKGEDGPGLDIASGGESAFERLSAREVQAGVQECIGTLDEEFREVLVLRDIQEYSYSEISSMLKLAEGTVKSRLFRAREALRDCLRKKLGGL